MNTIMCKATGCKREATMQVGCVDWRGKYVSGDDRKMYFSYTCPECVVEMLTESESPAETLLLQPISDRRREIESRK